MKVEMELTEEEAASLAYGVGFATVAMSTVSSSPADRAHAANLDRLRSRLLAATEPLACPAHKLAVDDGTPAEVEKLRHWLFNKGACWSLPEHVTTLRHAWDILNDCSDVTWLAEYLGWYYGHRALIHDREGGHFYAKCAERMKTALTFEAVRDAFRKALAEQGW